MINHDYFLEINSDKKAYFLGFFIADGCVSINKKQRCYGRFSFGIQEEDGYLLDVLGQEVNVKPCTIIYQNGITHRKPQKRLR